MNLQRPLFVLSTVAAMAVFVPTVLGGTPNGKGLYGEHLSYCTGFFEYGTAENLLPVTLVPGNGNSFWVNGYHLVIQSADVTDSATNVTTTYTFGNKTGQTTGPMERCEGDFPGYHVVSHDVVVP
jgi:hypothetical protein